ncbi:MAG: PorT family protein [Flavobacterium sp.]|jgi:hypothetical protein|uniref:PorT family protein n=1 Tax=Flavobacterium sp. TaxID=239 RepID=UPI003BA5D3FA
MKRYFLAIVFIITSLSVSAQYGKGDYNHIGLSIGANYSNLYTDNFVVTPQVSWTGGLAMRGNYYNDFAMVYGMNFTENRFSIQTISGLSEKETNLKMMAVQVHLLLSYKISGGPVSLDFGPVLQVNGKLKSSTSDENNLIVDNEDLSVKDIQEITPLNFNLHAGITGGFENVRLNLCYQYGVTNILNNLNKQEEVKLNADGKLKGNLGVIAGNIIFYF